MKLRRGTIVTLAAASLLLGGCAAAGGAAAPSGPTISPTGKTYPPGTPPSETKESTTATLFVAQGQFQKALDAAQQAIQADSANPVGYFLAGQAYAGLQEYAAADSMWTIAQRIYPAYELDIEPARETAWAQAFNAGVNAYNAGNVDSALVAWNNANEIYNKRVEAYQNLAAVYSQQQQYDQAIEAYRGGLAALDRTPASRELTEEEQADREKSRHEMVDNLAQLLSFTKQYAEAEKLYRQELQADSTNVAIRAKLAAAIAAQPGREADAQALYSQLLTEPGLSTNDVMNVGIALFNSQKYEQAAQAFKRVAEARANSRDAWYNYSNALYASNQYTALVPVAQKLVQLDPLNEDAARILAEAYKETKQNQKALQVLMAVEALPVTAHDLQVQVGDGVTTVRGQVTGNKAAAGTPLQLRFTFYAEDGTVLGTQTVTVNAPAKGETEDFEVSLQNPTPAAGYSYELVK